jgi:nicotinamidase/pyrazinamidase
MTKGADEDHEEYSIFKNTISCGYLTSFNNATKIDEVNFCGLAFDYCVKDSAIDSKKVFTNSKINIIKDLSPAIGEIDEVIKTLYAHNIDLK